MSRLIDAFILTYCRKIELFYGTELIFKTLRVGFPTARVTVVDNASLPEVRPRIEQLARETGCAFRQLPAPAIPHHQFIEQTLFDVARREAGTLVFLDPDLCLWANCEDLEFPGLVAGKLIDAYDDDVMKCVTMPRLHTSFLWIPDAQRLAAEIQRLRAVRFDFEPFQSFSVKLGDAWIRYDTGASLYAALADRISGFEARHMERYDHIFCGSHLDLLEPRMSEPLRAMMRTVHQHAREGHLDALRGIWKHQGRLWLQLYQAGSWREALRP